MRPSILTLLLSSLITSCISVHEQAKIGKSLFEDCERYCDKLGGRCLGVSDETILTQTMSENSSISKKWVNKEPEFICSPSRGGNGFRVSN